MARPEKEGGLAFVMDLIYLLFSTPVPCLCSAKKEKTDQYIRSTASEIKAKAQLRCQRAVIHPWLPKHILFQHRDSYSLSGFQLSVESQARPRRPFRRILTRGDGVFFGRG